MTNNNYSELFIKYFPLSIHRNFVKDSTYNRSYWVSIFLVELTVIGLAIICYIHAFQQGPFYLVALTTAVFFGLIVEYIYLTTMKGCYLYGPFVFMVRKTLPISIGISWGVIVYATVNLTMAIDIPWFAAPFINAFLAICLDAFIDPIAVSMGWWQWTYTTEEKYWFNVPVVNYYAWFWLVFSFSFFWRFFANLFDTSDSWAIALIANLLIILGSFVTLLLARKLQHFLRETCGISNERIVYGLVIISAAMGLIWVRPGNSLTSPFLLIIPAAFALLMTVILLLPNHNSLPSKYIFVILALLTNLFFWLPFLGTL